MIYLRGLTHLLAHIASGGEYEPLLVGKFGAGHLDIIRELQWRKVLAPSPLRPRYLEHPDSLVRLERVRRGITVLDLLKGA